MNARTIAVNFASSDSYSSQVLIKHSTPNLAAEWQRRAHAAEERCVDLREAMCQAADWLRLGAPGKAMETLENILSSQ